MEDTNSGPTTVQVEILNSIIKKLDHIQTICRKYRSTDLGSDILPSDLEQ